MSSDFDPYRMWLSIPANEQPANYYRLLGVEMFESDDEVISSAADRQITHVRSFQSGEYSEQAQKILKELALAQVTLLNKTKKDKYDAQLRSKINASSDPKIDDTIVVELPPPPPSSKVLSNQSKEHQKKKDAVKAVNKNSSASITPYVVVLLSAMVLELFLFTGFFLFYRSKQQTAADMILEKAESLYRQSVDLEKENNYSEALSKMNAACELAPENEAYITRESLLKKLVIEKKTEELYKQSIELESKIKYGEALIKMNAVCELAPEKKDYKSARQRIKALFEASPIPAGRQKFILIKNVPFTLRYCPPGTFTMGGLKPESERYDIFDTPHQVTLTKGFWMTETEVTQEQWKGIMGNNPSENIGDKLPVENISWENCQEFCKQCAERGFPVQLPTGEQWEYACRAGTTGDHAGNIEEMAWYRYNSDDKTHPVKMKKPNAWGLYDMHGNVWEWCQDLYAPSFGASRIYRGGCYLNNDYLCRSACRLYHNSDHRAGAIGFRFVIEQE